MSAALRIHMTGSDWYRTSRGGLNRYFSDLFTELRGRDDVVVTAAAHGRPDAGGDSWGPVDRGTAARVRSSRTPIGADADVLDRHFALYGPRPRGAALVTHFHGPWALESAAAGQHPAGVAMKKLIERGRYRSSDRFVVLSESFGRVLTTEYGIAPDAIRVIPPGVDLDRFQPAPIATEAPRVLCVRRLEQRMGIDVLLQAWPAVLAAVPDARLDIAGKGSMAGELAATITRLGIGDSARLLGETSDDELDRAYRDATVTVVPTRSLEGFGLIALESLASGRAPVVTDVGGLPDSVRGLDPTLVVPPDDPQALASRLISALRGDRPGVAECRAQAERYSWRACGDRHVELYREVLR